MSERAEVFRAFSDCRDTARGSVEGKTPFNTGTAKCNKFFQCRLA
jgi:hypothetical protein